MTTSRDTVREQLVSAITPSMTSAKSVFDGRPAKLKGNTPAVAVISFGADRTSKNTLAGFGVEYLFGIAFYVKYADPDKGWSPDQARDMADTLEGEFAAFMDSKANLKTSYWKNIRYDEPSDQAKVPIEGETYLVEAVQIRVRPR